MGAGVRDVFLPPSVYGGFGAVEQAGCWADCLGLAGDRKKRGGLPMLSFFIIFAPIKNRTIIITIRNG